MTAPAMSYDDVKALKPCADDFRRVVKLLGGSKSWNGQKISAAQAREAGATLDDIVWIASAVAHTDADVERRLRLWMADCAAHVLHIYERDHPDDDRPRNAIVAARQYARGEIDEAAWAAARAAAWAAARDAEASWQYDRLILWLSDPERRNYGVPDRERGMAVAVPPDHTIFELAP